MTPTDYGSPLYDSDEQSPTEALGDILYWLLYHSQRTIKDSPTADLSRFAPHHEDLALMLSAFDDAGGDAKGAMAARKVWLAIRRKWPELAAAVAGQDIRKTTHVQQLIRLGIEAELFETSEEQAYARVPINGYYDVLPLTERGSGFQPWLARRFYEETLGHPHSAAMAQAMLWLRGQARYGQLVRDVHTRVAWDETAVYLDLANAAHQVVKITAEGWEIDDHPPVYFRRASGALPLPFPDDEGSFEDLFGLINLPPETDAHKLIAGWLIHTLMPDGPYAHLCIHGEQGSAKSFLTKVLRQLIDPNKAPTKSNPKEEHDLAVMARHSYILAFDNLSSLPEWLSDALCQLSTGAGLGTRKLYTDDDETVFFAKRPVVLNGIAEVAVRGDLIDRCVFVTLPKMQRRVDEKKLWRRFQEVQPRILGAVVKAVCEALNHRDRLTIRDLPRMADFTLWVEAAAPALGWKPGEFLTAYRRNRANAVHTEIEASPVARTLLAFIAHQPVVTLLMGELLDRLTAIVTAGGAKDPPSSWPKSAQALSGALRRLAPALRAQGIELEFLSRTEKGKPISIRRDSEASQELCDGSKDVVIDEREPDEVADEPDDMEKSSSAQKPVSMKPSDEPDDFFHKVFKEVTKEKEEDEALEKRGRKSSSSSSSLSDAVMDAAFSPDEVKMSSSGSSASSSAEPPCPECDVHGMEGMFWDETIARCGLCLGMPLERIELLRQRRAKGA